MGFLQFELELANHCIILLKESNWSSTNSSRINDRLKSWTSMWNCYSCLSSKHCLWSISFLSKVSWHHCFSFFFPTSGFMWYYPFLDPVKQLVLHEGRYPINRGNMSHRFYIIQSLDAKWSLAIIPDSTGLLYSRYYYYYYYCKLILHLIMIITCYIQFEIH